VRPLLVLRLTRSELDPVTGAMTVSDTVAGAAWPQPAPWPDPPPAAPTVSVPEDGVAVSPL
jgi:hypothetical protein